MIGALRLELTEIKKKGGGKQIDVRGGERIGTADRHVLYRFPLAEDFDVRDETPIRIVCGQQEVDGSIVSIKDYWLTVALEEDLGPKIPYARLIADDSFLIERLLKKLEEVDNGSAAFNHTAAQRVIGEGCIDSGTVEPATQIWQGSLLNSEQQEAVRRSLGSDTTFIWGPPGTGKTTVLARIVEGLYRSGRSVLLVSNTNIAVDTALMQIAKRLEGDPPYYKGLLLRHGNATEKIDPIRKNVVIDEVVERRSVTIQNELNQVLREIQRLSAQAEPYRQGIQAHENTARLQTQKAGAEQSLAGNEKRHTDLRREELGCRSRIAKLKDDLQRAQNTNAFLRLLQGLNLERLTRELGDTEGKQLSIQEALASISSALNSERTQLNELIQKCQEAEASAVKHPALPLCRTRLQEYEQQTSVLRHQVQELEAKLAAIRQEIINNCRILATTIYRTYLPGQFERQFDVVVIDEASMLMLPMSYFAAGIAQQSVVVAGDFRQLPPIVICNDAACKEWLEQDVFVKSGIHTAVRTKKTPDSLVALRQQFRMEQGICDCINQFFYSDHQLETVKRPRELANNPLTASALSFIDTSAFNPWTSVKLGSYSRYNLFHALLIRNLACHLSNEGYITADTFEHLGITAPYSAQVRLLQALIEEKLPVNVARGLAATVHRFQGNERDTIIVDLPDSIGFRLGQFMKGSQPEDAGTRLLNVAISRARGHIILVANFDYLRDKAPQESLIHGILDHFEARGEALDIEGVLPLGDRDWIDGISQIDISKLDLPADAGGLFSEGTFYPAFSQDINNAGHHIVIFSPFLTERGTSRWANHFIGAIQRGVAVRIITRPPGDHGGTLDDSVEEIITNLRHLGVVVDLRARMHEKVALIDDETFWHGSLNILSHRDTSESMMRLPSEALCRQFARFITTPSGGNDDNIDITQQENPECPLCGQIMVWNTGQYGIYFTCPVLGCAGKLESRRPSSSGRRSSKGKSTNANMPSKPCPSDCGGRLVRRNGRNGPFLGCTNYPRCKVTENIR